MTPSFLSAVLMASLLTVYSVVIRADSPEYEFVAAVRNEGVAPTALIAKVMKTHSVVFIGDSHTAAEPKEILIDTIENFEKDQGVDFVVLEVSSTYQKEIDQYLASKPEDTSILLNNPPTLRAHWGVSVDYLNIYRSIWRINQTRQTGHQIKVLAADHPNWPPPQNTSAKDIADIMKSRDEHMMQSVEANILIPNIKAKTLVFMGSFHGAKTGSFEIIFDTDAVSQVQPLGSRINNKYPGIIFSTMVDGMPDIEEYENGLKSYGFGPYFDQLFSTQPVIPAPTAILIDTRFDFVTAPFYRYEDVFWSDGIKLREQFDAYVYLGKADFITLVK